MKQNAVNFRRRSFVKYASLAAAGQLAGLRPFGVLNALASTHAAAADDYKALVCVFLYGGNDTNNVVIPFDTAGYANYAALRGPLALAQGSLLQLASAPGFAFHPKLAELQALFNSGAAAVVANVGTLQQPLTRAEYLAGLGLPQNLFSHPDQQNEWQNAEASGLVRTGWAGRLADAMAGSYNAAATMPMVTSVAGSVLFGSGVTTMPAAVSPVTQLKTSCSEGRHCTDRTSAAQLLLQLNSGVSLVTADQAIASKTYEYGAALTAALAAGSTLATAFPGSNSLATQLNQVAKIIQVRSALGVKRQIFFCGLGGFDTHSGQLGVQASLLGQVSTALAAFYQATQELGVAGSVTTFTMSDFARTLEPNSNSGSDHAWGSHQIVVGGAVNGGAMYGTFPTLALAGPDDMGSNGRWIPTTGSVQYAATLAAWFGVAQDQLGTVFPTLANFSTSRLGFV